MNVIEGGSYYLFAPINNQPIGSHIFRYQSLFITVQTSTVDRDRTMIYDTKSIKTRTIPSWIVGSFSVKKNGIACYYTFSILVSLIVTNKYSIIHRHIHTYIFRAKDKIKTDKWRDSPDNPCIPEKIARTKKTYIEFSSWKIGEYFYSATFAKIVTYIKAIEEVQCRFFKYLYSSSS